MSRTRCTLKIKGLDCPTEMRALQGALEGWPGVAGLEFDLIQGTMAVEYDPTATNPPALARRVVDATGFSAVPVSGTLLLVPSTTNSRESGGLGVWWAKQGHWALTFASGVTLLVGMMLDLAGVTFWVGRGFYALAIGFGGAELLPKAIRALGMRRLDMHVLMTVAVLGASPWATGTRPRRSHSCSDSPRPWKP